MIDAFIESKIDLTRFDDLFHFSCSFDKLQAILKILILQSKQQTDSINNLFKQTALMDK